LLLLAACASLVKPWKTPEVALASLRLKALGFSKQSFLVGLRIRNPNDRTLPVTAMNFRLYLEGDEIATGSSELDRRIPAFGEELVQVEVNSDLMGLMPRLPTLVMKNDDLQWKITGTATVAGMITLPYSYSGSVDPKALLSDAVRYR
jgi:LEA14-like dessication related protein